MKLEYLILLSFGKPLPAQHLKLLFLDNNQCLPRPILINSNLDELCYYQFFC